MGVGIAGDARKVFSDHNVSVDAIEDLSRLANQKLGGQPKMWGLSSLTEKLTCKQVSYHLQILNSYICLETGILYSTRKEKCSVNLTLYELDIIKAVSWDDTCVTHMRFCRF